MAEGYGVDPKFPATPPVRGHTRDLMPAARSLQSAMIEAEQVLWQALCGGQVGGLRFRRRPSVRPFALDCCCSQAKLAIEVDGGVHLDADQAARDAERTAHLAAYGSRVLCVANGEVLNDLPTAVEAIRGAAQTRERPP